MGQTINQVRHLYVVNDLSDINLVTSSDLIYFKYTANGQTVVSDKIQTNNITYLKHTKAEAMAKKLNKHTITIKEAIKGVAYTIRLTFKNYIGFGDNNMTFKYGDAVGTGSAETLAADIKASLEANLKDMNNLATVAVSGSTITITEVAQDWARGKMAKAVIPFEVDILPVVVEGVESTEWATKTKTADGGVIKNGYDIADLEYFCMGARGDIYRGMGYPHNIETKYLVDETAEYDILDIHYYYDGANESVQKSEKDITLAFPKGTVISAITGPLETATGLTTIVVPKEQGN